MTPEEIAEAKDKLLDRIEEFLIELLGMTSERASMSGVGKSLQDKDNPEFDDFSEIDMLLDDITELRHQEEIAGVIQAGKKVTG